MKYYISRAGQQYGPYSLEDLRRMQGQGQVDANDLVWADGMASWTALSQVLDSTAAPAPAAAAAAAPAQQPYVPPQAQYQPPQYTPQAQAPAPAYAPAAYNPGYAPPQPAAGGPMPPNMNWILVLVLCYVTGIFGIIWLFMELGFVKKIDPASTAMKQYIMGLIALPAGFIAFGIFFVLGSTTNSGSLVALGGVCAFAGFICMFVFSILAVFGMRRSIETYYNTVEPIGLRLSPIMTFFFSIIYFQYHFDRIINWKTTGRLM